MNRKEYNRLWRIKNAEKLRESKRIYSQSEAGRACAKRSWSKHKEKRKAEHRAWVDKNREKVKEYHHKYNPAWYKKNKEKRDARGKLWGKNPGNKKKRVKYVQKYVQGNIEKVRDYRKSFEQTVSGKYRQLMWRAKHFGGTPITLEEFEVLISQPCAYCGDEGKVGVDRIDNKKGYTLENSASCCTCCNFMKKAMSIKDFLSHIKKIYIHNEKRI